MNSSGTPKLRPRTELIPEHVSCLDRVYMTMFWVTLLAYTFTILFGELLVLPKNDLSWCLAAEEGLPMRKYPNPDTPDDPCYYERTMYLLGLSIFECDFARRMLASVVLGAAIGFERKAADRPAGIRTMSLVCLGAGLFTMCGQFAFRSSTMTWDAARVSAAIPSGVGFLGSALIWKESTGNKDTPQEKHQVHGLATAASVWLSASVGIGVGGGLYIYSIWAVVLVLFVLRLGPHVANLDDNSYGGDQCDTEDWDTGNEDGDSDEGHGLSREEQLFLLKQVTSMDANGREQHSPSKHGARHTPRKGPVPAVSFHN